MATLEIKNCSLRLLIASIFRLQAFIINVIYNGNGTWIFISEMGGFLFSGKRGGKLLHYNSNSVKMMQWSNKMYTMYSTVQIPYTTPRLVARLNLFCSLGRQR